MKTAIHKLLLIVLLAAPCFVLAVDGTGTAPAAPTDTRNVQAGVTADSLRNGIDAATNERNDLLKKYGEMTQEQRDSAEGKKLLESINNKNTSIDAMNKMLGDMQNVQSSATDPSSGQGGSPTGGGQQPQQGGGGAPPPPSSPPSSESPKKDDQSPKADNNNNNNNNNQGQDQKIDTEPKENPELVKAEEMTKAAIAEAEARKKAAQASPSDGNVNAETQAAIDAINNKAAAQVNAIAGIIEDREGAANANGGEGSGGRTQTASNTAPEKPTLGDRIQSFGSGNPTRVAAGGDLGNSLKPSLGGGTARTAGAVTGGTRAAGGDLTPAEAESEISAVATSKKRGAVRGAANGTPVAGESSSASSSSGSSSGADALLASLSPRESSSGSSGSTRLEVVAGSRNPASVAPRASAPTGSTRGLAARVTPNYKMNISAPRALQTTLSRIQPQVLGSTPQSLRKITR